MGTVYKRGRIWYVNTIAGSRRIRKRIGTSRKLAGMALKELEAKIIRSELDLDFNEVYLIDLFEKFLDYSQVNHSPNTYLRYKNVIENFLVFTDLVLSTNIDHVSNLKPPHFEEYKKYRRTVDPRTIRVPNGYPIKIRENRLPAKTRTLNFELKTLRSIFGWGIKQGLCRDNPAKGIQLLKVTDSKKPRFLTIDECREFLKACSEDQFPIFFTFLNTGLRLGELLNLQWVDIDFPRQRLKVQQKDFWIPKAGEREVPLNDEMIRLFSDMKLKVTKPSDFVFSHRNGGPLKRKLRQDVIDIAKRARLNDMTKVHTFRHTFASQLIMSGVDLPTVQRLLGHTDIQTTMIYSHLAPDHLEGAVNKLSFT